MLRLLFWIGLVLLGAVLFEAIAEASPRPLARCDRLAHPQCDLR